MVEEGTWEGRQEGEPILQVEEVDEGRLEEEVDAGHLEEEAGPPVGKYL